MITNQATFSPPSTVTSFIAQRQVAAGLSDAQVADLTPFPSEAVYRLLKSGLMKLNVIHVPGLAKALNVEAGELLQVAMGEYQPEVLAAVQHAWGPLALSATERQIIQHARHVVSGNNRLVSVIFNGEPMPLQALS